MCVHTDEDRAARWYQRWWRGLTRLLFQKVEREQKRYLLKKTVLTGLSSAIRLTPNIFSQQDFFNLIYFGEKYIRENFPLSLHVSWKSISKGIWGQNIELKSQVSGVFFFFFFLSTRSRACRVGIWSLLLCLESSFVHSIPSYWVSPWASHWNWWWPAKASYI